MFRKEPKDQIITYKIEQKIITQPKEDECVVFQFPKDTPKELMAEFDRRLIEFQNQQRSFITTNMEIKFIKTKKGKLEVYNENQSDNTTGHPEPSGKG